MYNQKELLLEVMTLPFTDIDLKFDMIVGESKDKVINNIHKRQTIYSVDEIGLLIKKFFGKNIKSPKNSTVDEYITILSHIDKICNSFMSYRNGTVCIKYWKESDDSNSDFLGPYSGIEKISLWNSLSRLMCTDFLVCYYLSQNPKKNNLLDSFGISLSSSDNTLEKLDNYNHQILLEDVHLSSVLKKGVSETHLHASAGINFNQTWHLLMYPDNKFVAYDYFKKRPIISRDNLGELILIKASIFRCLIILFISKKHENIQVTAKYLDMKIHMDYDEGGYSNFEFDSVIQRLLYIDDDSFSTEFLKKINKNIHKIMELEIETSQMDKSTDYLVNHYLNTEYRPNVLNTVGENIFLFKVFNFINSNDKKFHLGFLNIFFYYVRCKNMFFQEIVQLNQIKGLTNFQKYFYTSTKTFGKISNKTKWEMILRNQFSDKNLKKLELRISMCSSGSIKKIKKKFLDEFLIMLISYEQLLEKSLKNESTNIPIVGIIIHFIKDIDKEDKCWMNYDSNKISTYKYLSYQKKRHEYLNIVLAIKELKENYKFMSNFIIGIDAASNENSTEPWVFAPIYDIARDGNDRIYYSASHQNLGFTFHVGEDFRHIITGLRRMDEVIEHFKYRSGDRIGHGIALGLDVKKWVDNHSIVVMPRIEYLENLLWIWGIYKDQKLVAGIDGFLERRIMQIANDIYISMEGITVYELWKSYRIKFEATEVNCDYLPKCNETCSFLNNSRKKNELFCSETDQSNTYLWNSNKLSLSYHCNVYLERMNEIISVKSDELGVNIMEDIQSLIKSKVSEDGIVIETNPTSNRSIGEMDDIFNHYILNLKNKRFEDKSRNENIIVTINTDDPCVFQTTLSSEFAYIYYALVDKGYPKKDVIDWIDEVREKWYKNIIY